MKYSNLVLSAAIFLSATSAFSAQKIDCTVFGAVGTYGKPAIVGFVRINDTGRPTARFSHPLDASTKTGENFYMIHQEFTAIAQDATGSPVTYRYDVSFDGESGGLSVGIGNPKTGAGARTEMATVPAMTSSLVGDQSEEPRGLIVGVQCVVVK